jgi:hypothetical protein
MSTAPFAALREWASVVDDVRAGHQSLLVRKGGISEGSQGFSAESAHFLLLPTLFHQHAGQPPALPDVLSLDVVCELLLAVEVPSDADLSPLAPFHRYSPDALAVRVRYKPEKPLTLLAIRARRLANPILLPSAHLPATCRSWVLLPVSSPLDSATTPIPHRHEPALVAALQSLAATPTEVSLAAR